MLKELILNYDPYDNSDSDMSITDVGKGIRMIILNKRHKAWLKSQPLSPIEQDSSITSALGRAWDMYVDSICEANPDYMGHTRLYYPVVHNGRRYIISGEIDLYHKPTKTIIDNKCVTMNKKRRLLSDEKSEYSDQLNGYYWLMQEGFLDKECTKPCNITAEHLMLCVVGRDWDMFSNEESMTEISVPIEQLADTKKKIFRKLKDKIDYDMSADKDIPYCSAEDRWEHEPTYPVFKKNKDGSMKDNPTAMPGTRLFKHPNQAENFIASHKHKNQLYWCKRGGEPVRCMSYCKLSGRKCDYLTRRNAI